MSLLGLLGLVAASGDVDAAAADCSMSLLNLLEYVALFGAAGGFLNGVHINFRSNLRPTDPADVGVTDENQREALTNAITKKKGERPGSIAFNTVAGAVSAAAS